VCNKPAITDHICCKNQTTDTENAKVKDQASDKIGTLIRQYGSGRPTARINMGGGELPTEPRLGQAVNTNISSQKKVPTKAGVS